jgi:hypothetical protein
LINKQTKLAAIIIIALLGTIGFVYAATVLTSPEHVTGTPLDQPIPTPTPTPTPTPSTQPTAIQLSSNNTDPFYKGDTLRMTAQLNQPVAGITVTLFNNGNSVASAITDATGKAVFDRQPTLPFDYNVTATIP